jgi:hypothetical protein
MSVSCLETLPVELLYRIIDNIDTKTVFLSFRYVCKRFYAIINSQNRYKLDFRYISKTNFYQVCRLIRPENVSKLILSDGNETVGQIGLFRSIFDLHLFTRLSSLTLIQVNESQSEIFLNHIITCPIVSLSIEYQHEQKLNMGIIDLLSSTIEKFNNLRKFELKVKYFLIKNIRWPLQNTIQYLTLNCCAPFQFLIILQDLPHLKTLVLYDFDMAEIFIPSSFKITSSLKSLSIEQSLIHFDKIQFFLSLTPLLIHLKLTGWPLSDILLNGSRWEEFIQTKLPYLNKFEFFFRIFLKEQTMDNLQSIIASYQTLFWLEYKHWYVTYDYIIDTSTLHLYSIPICETKFILDCDMKKISYSTFNKTNAVMDNISHLQVNSIPSMIFTTSKNEQSNIQYFCNVKELTLYIKDSWPKNSIEYFSMIIDFSHLIKLSLNSDLDENSVNNAAILITGLIERAHNLQSLVISYPLSYQLNMEWIYTIVSNKIKHLEIDLFNRRYTNEFLSRLDHLSSITLIMALKNYNDYISFLENKKNNTFRKKNSSISLWLGRDQNDLFKMKYDVKRVKLTHDYNTSSIYY